jgi:pimeloyl-ACP methyl ester carboxylesterase
VPTLVVVGEKDELTPPHEAAAIASGIAGSKLVTIPDSGHLPPLERLGAFRSSLRGLLAEVGA